MLRLAIGGHESFVVSDIEIARGGVSYTVDTVQDIANQRPDDELYLLMGADSLIDFPKWRSPERIGELAKLLVVGRPDSPPPDMSVLESTGQNVAESAVYVSMPLLDFSSTEIRRRVAATESIRFRTPRSVEKYIEANRLYK
jgi:nicotinate-nucleotide adenylyltransferase